MQFANLSSEKPWRDPVKHVRRVDVVQVEDGMAGARLLRFEVGTPGQGRAGGQVGRAAGQRWGSQQGWR